MKVQSLETIFAIFIVHVFCFCGLVEGSRTKNPSITTRSNNIIEPHTERSRSLWDSWDIGYLTGRTSTVYKNDLKRASLKFKKSQDRKHRVRIYKKGCIEEITNDDTLISNVTSVMGSVIHSTNDVEFDVAITFNSNIQNTPLFVILQENMIEQDNAQIEICVQVDLLYEPEDGKTAVSIVFEQVEYIWTIKLDTISAFSLSGDLSGADYKLFRIIEDDVVVSSDNEESSKYDEISIPIVNKDLGNPIKTSEIEVKWTTSNCTKELDSISIVDRLILDEENDSIVLYGRYKHSELLNEISLEDGATGGDIEICAKIRRHFNPENAAFGEGAGQDACACMFLDVSIEDTIIRQRQLPMAPPTIKLVQGIKASQDKQIVERRKMSSDDITSSSSTRRLNDHYVTTHVENTTVVYKNPYDQLPTPVVASTSAFYEVKACLCNEIFDCDDDLIISQGSTLHICLEVKNSQDVFIDSVAEFDIIQQDGGVTLSPIHEQERNGLTDVIYQGAKAIVMTQLPSSFFSSPSPAPLVVSGAIIGTFATTSNSQRRQLLRKRATSLIKKWKSHPLQQQQSTISNLQQKHVQKRQLSKGRRWSVQIKLTNKDDTSTFISSGNDASHNVVVLAFAIVGASLGMAAIIFTMFVWSYERYENQQKQSICQTSQSITDCESIGKGTLTRISSDKTWVTIV